MPGLNSFDRFARWYSRQLYRFGDWFFNPPGSTPRHEHKDPLGMAVCTKCLRDEEVMELLFQKCRPWHKPYYRVVKA